MEMDKSGNRKRVILKLGSSTLTRGTDHLSRGKIEDIARQLQSLSDKYEFILVSSGAIAVARQFVKLRGDDTMEVKQALAAIGQPHLMRIYYEIFSEFGLPTSQCLLTYRDFNNEESKKNIIQTINSLLAHGYVPIINENDTTATEEIKFGDNDKLAALASQLLNVDLLIMATNTHGLLTGDPNINPHVETIREIKNLEEIKSAIGDTKSKHGSGGMRSKIEATEIAQKAGVETWLVNGHKENFLNDCLNGVSEFTKVLVK